MSDQDEKIIVELTRDEYATLKEMLRGQAAWDWVRNRSKGLALTITAIIAAFYALAELIARLGGNAIK
jgi:hypothetical protein